MKTNNHRAISLFLGLVFMSMSSTLFAKDEQAKPTAEPQKDSYRLVYAKESPMKDIPLNEATFKVHFYSNGIPKGYHEYKTNEQSEFALTHSDQAKGYHKEMTLIQLQDQAKYHQICLGHLVQNKNEIQVTCHKKEQKIKTN